VSAEAAQPSEPEPCVACRGTGRLVSNLGGEARMVECPWCDGGGVRLAGHDAQARWRDQPPGDGDDRAA
jgi:DnaJ-class molecular chaperone